MAKCLVTGGAGFIGSNLADRLIAGGHQVSILDDLSTGKREYLNPKARFYQQDISLKGDKIEGYFAGVDWVFHLAAWPRVPKSVEDPVGTNRVNVDGTLNVLQACRNQKVKKVIYSSSSSVYGTQKTYEMKEDMIPNPLSPYALQKLIGDQYCKLFAYLFDMNIVSLRYFNVYGERQPTEGAYCLVMGTFLRQKAEGKPMTINGDGNQMRSYVCVKDVVEANILAATVDLERGWRCYNIGTNIETSVNQIADMIGGERIHIIPNPRGKFEELRKSANFDKALAELGWKPTISIEEGIKALL
jgi:UDP-glucose 4-epimerase